MRNYSSYPIIRLIFNKNEQVTSFA